MTDKKSNKQGGCGCNCKNSNDQYMRGYRNGQRRVAQFVLDEPIESLMDVNIILAKLNATVEHNDLI